MREKLTDLHCHSVYSDGTCTPEEIVKEAKRIGLSSVALTDHDAIDGIEEFHKAGKKHNIETITGIELAAQHNRFHREEIHIVGLGFDVNSVPLKRLMEQIAIDRDTRNHIIIEELNKHGYNITLEEVLQTSKNGVLMRSHFITLLLQKGYQESGEYLFDKFLSVNSRAFKEIDFASSQKIISTVHEAGGVAVLAHPTLYNLTDSKIESLVSELKGYGLDGIEVEYTTYTPEQAEFITSLVNKYNLLYSGGSDFHGTYKPGVYLGIGKGNLKIPYSYWIALKERCLC